MNTKKEDNNNEFESDDSGKAVEDTDTISVNTSAHPTSLRLPTKPGEQQTPIRVQ